MDLLKRLFKAIYLGVFIAISNFGYSYENSPSSLIIKNIPFDDKCVLIELFQLLFSNGDFAYAFLGIKPMCKISYTMQYIRKFPENERFSRETYLARKGLKIWKKYQHLFAMGNIQFLTEESDQYEGCFSFILINPEKCLRIIERHLSLFQNYYGEKIPADELVKWLCRGSYFKEGKIDHQVLGLLLGYPEKDVLTFNDQLKNLKSSKNKDSLRPCYLAVRQNPLTPIRAPYFMTNRKEIDLKDLKSEYAAKKQELITFYYSDDFLEKILDRFM